MGYTDGGLFEVRLVDSGSLATAAVIGSQYCPGYMPVTVRAISVVLKTAASCAGVVQVKKWPTPGSSASESVIGTVAIPNAQAAGTVVYKGGLNVKVSPGEAMVAECTDATGNGTQTADVMVLLEPSFENPANNTDMTAGA